MNSIIKGIAGFIRKNLIHFVFIIIVFAIFFSIERYAEYILTYNENLENFIEEFPTIKKHVQCEFETDEQLIERINKYRETLGSSLLFALKNNSELDTGSFWEYAADQYSGTLTYLDGRKNVRAVYGSNATDWSKPEYASLFAGGMEDYNKLETELDGKPSIIIATRVHGGYAVYTNDLEVPYDEEERWDMALGNISITGSLQQSVIDNATKEIVFSEKEEVVGETLDECEFYTDGSCYATLLTDENEKYTFYGMKYDDSNTILVSSFGDAGTDRDHIRSVGLMLTAIFVLLLFVYALIMRNETRDPQCEIKIGRFYVNPKNAGKYISVGAILYIVILLAMFFVSFMYKNISIASSLKDDSTRVSEIVSYYEESEKNEGTYWKERYLMNAYLTDTILYITPEFVNKSDLTKIANKMDFNDISIFDANGKVVATSSDYDHMNFEDFTDEDKSTFKDLLLGKENICGDFEIDKDGNRVMKIGISRSDDEGVANGFIIVSVDYNVFETIKESYSIDNNLLNLCVSGDSYVFTVNTQDMTIDEYPDNQYAGWNISDIGINSDIIKDKYSGIVTVSGVPCICYVVEPETLEDTAVVLVNSIQNIMSHCINHCLLISIVMLLSAVWFGIFTLFHSNPAHDSPSEKTDREKEEEAKKPGRRFLEAIGWYSLSDKSNAEKKLLFIIRILFYAFAIFVFFCCIFEGINGRDSIISFINSERWMYGLNQFALTASVITVCNAAVLILIAKRLLIFIGNILDARGETICRLLDSLLKYAICIASVYRILIYAGVDADTVLASLGIASMAVGLGAKDMISDAIAGMFIIFEGNYKVGDMMIIDGDWYWVKSIGIRTTKFESYGGTKVINNSAMTKITNTTSYETSADCDITIGNEYVLSDIEEIFEAELPKLRSKFPADVDGPYYKGVKAMDGTGTTIKIRLYCHLVKKGKNGRKLNTEVRKILDKYNIRIGHPCGINEPDPKEKVRVHYIDDTFYEEQPGEAE